MCGIAGWLGAGGKHLPAARFAKALDRIRHRGPDDEGFLTFDPAGGEVRTFGGPDTIAELQLPGITQAGDSNVLLGHRRLSIIDLSSAGHQPMSTPDGRYWIVYNGEIYNYLELRAELATSGVEFRTHSDTEVLLQGFARHGPRVLEKLIGMFAFALLDTRERRLFLARDHFGIKPLYYVRKNGFLCFASEIKALFEFPDVSRRAGAQPSFQLLRFGERSADEQTLLADVRQVPAASWMSVSLETLDCTMPATYWAPHAGAIPSLTFAQATDAVRSAVEDSLRLHLRSDVPVGACLSGGLDSSLLCSLIKREFGDAKTLHTFSFISEEQRYSEEPYVDMIEGVATAKTRPSAAEFAADLERLMEAQNLPFMNLGVYAQFRVFRLAHEHGMKVMIDGQGADEIFGGYAALMGSRLTGLLARGRLLDAARLYRQLPDTLANFRRRTALVAVGRLLPGFMQKWAIRLGDADMYPPWLNAGWFEERGVRPTIRQHGRGAHTFREELVLAIRQTSLPQLLRYEDGSSMHFSIESRVPYCNPRIAELALALPEDFLINVAGDTKRVLRSAAEGVVPEAILRREKLGFTAPDRHWMRSARKTVDELLHDYARARAPFLNHAQCVSMVDEALNSDGYWPSQVWNLVGFLAWSRHNDISFD